MTAPVPRPGLDAVWDRLVGPGANAAEQAAVVAAASVGAIAGGLLPRRRTERLLGAAIGADAAGGLVANETTPVKRWYHREGQPAWEPAAFAAFHVYPFLVEAASGRRAWGRAALAWALPVLASGVVAAVQSSRPAAAGPTAAGPTAAPRSATRPAPARPVAAVLATGVAAAGAALAPAGWRWLPPLLAVKLVFGHATADGGPLARLLRPEPADMAR